MSLKAWFDRNAIRPIKILYSLVLVGFVSLSVAAFIEDHFSTKEVLRNLRSLGELALEQRNLSLLESSLLQSLRVLKSSEVVACQQGRTIFSFPAESKNCELIESSSWTPLSYTVSLSSDSTYFYFRQSPIQKFGPFAVIIVVILFSFFGVMYLLSHLKSRLEKDIISFMMPRSDLSTCHVAEVVDLLKKRTALEVSEGNLRIRDAVIASNRRTGHDMKSPLTALKAVAFNMGRGSRAETLVLEAIKQLTTMADELLSGRPSSDPDISHEIVKVSDLISLFEDTMSSKYLEYPNAQIAHSTSLLDELNMSASSLELDRPTILRIFSNIVNNSIEAILPEPLNIKLNIVTSTTTVSLSFIDNGPGFPNVILSNQGRDKLSLGKSFGNGLGIYSVADSVSKVGGSLTLRNVLPKGALTELVVPLDLKVDS